MTPTACDIAYVSNRYGFEVFRLCFFHSILGLTIVSSESAFRRNVLAVKRIFFARALNGRVESHLDCNNRIAYFANVLGDYECFFGRRTTIVRVRA